MKRTALTKISVLLGFTFMLVSLFQVSTALSSNNDKSLVILSNVFNLELSKYNVILNGTSDNFNSAFGPNLNQQSIVYTLASENSVISADVQFVGSSFWYCNLEIKGNPIYAQAQSAIILDQSKNVIQRYQAYAAQYSLSNTSYISLMASTLNSVSELKSTSVTEGNMKLEISLWATRFSNIPKQTFRWFYTENGMDVTRKGVTVEYTDGVLTSISDTWNLYEVGSINSISREEAINIAWSQAQNLKLQFLSEDGSIYEIKPDLSNVTTEAVFGMYPRNNTAALCPSWLVTFWFAKPYGQDHGIEVGIWGDTKEVVFCTPLILGGSDASEPTAQTSFSGSNSSGSTTQAQPHTGNGLEINLFLMIMVGIGLIAAILAAGIVFKRRRNIQ